MKTSARYPIAIVATLLGTLLTSAQVKAYTYYTCDSKKIKWPSPTAQLTPLSISFPSGSVQRGAFDELHRNLTSYAPASPVGMSIWYSSNTGYNSDNEVNEICYTSSYGWGSSTLAVTIISSSDVIEEADVLFNTAYAWDFSWNPSPVSTGLSFIEVGLHELGHAFGLGHEDRYMETMNSYYPFGGTLSSNYYPDPHADELAGLRFLYGTPYAARDVAASVYRATGSGSSSLIMPPTSATRGSIVNLTYTLSNRGTQTENYITIYFYASTDRFISTLDTYLGQAAYWINPATEVTTSLTVPIPTYVATGPKYLGFILDPTNTIPEFEESNNSVAYVNTTQIN